MPTPVRKYREQLAMFDLEDSSPAVQGGAKAAETPKASPTHPPVTIGRLGPNARNADPATSHDAGEAVRGKRIPMATVLLRAFAAAGPEGYTDEEAADAAGLATGWWKRCSDLRHLGLIRATGALRTSRAGMDVMVCAITDAGRHHLERA